MKNGGSDEDGDVAGIAKCVPPWKVGGKIRKWIGKGGGEKRKARGKEQTLLTFFACCTCSVCGRNVATRRVFRAL